jgi:hypothetical protein
MKKNNRILIYPLIVMGFLLILTSSCKKDINNDNDSTTYTIGQSYGGGIIFYIDDTKQHGLVCAPTDQSTALQWWNGRNVITNANGSEIGTGKANTETIVAVQGTGNYAAQICNDLILNGYNDWFLPSKVECFYMYFNLKTLRNLGNFADTLYWSSTEASTNNAYSQFSNDGYPPNGGYYKNSAHYVRAVRAF